MRNYEKKTKNIIDLFKKYVKAKIFKQKCSCLACLKVNVNTVQWKRYDLKSKSFNRNDATQSSKNVSSQQYF